MNDTRLAVYQIKSAFQSFECRVLRVDLCDS